MVVTTKSSKSVTLEGFPAGKQGTPFSCGPKSVQLILEYLGHKVEETEIIRRMRCNKIWGAPPWLLERAFRKYIEELEPTLRLKMVSGSGVNTQTLLDSLNEGFPALISFLTVNQFRPPNLVAHYSVAIGVDEEAGEAAISNPFGYVEKFPLDKFWRAMDYTPENGDMFSLFKAAKRLGVLKPRTMFLLEKQI